MQKQDIQVRIGMETDLPAVLGLIQELAEYEKAPSEVSVTLSEMQRDGFGPQAIFTFFVAETAQGIVGMALCYEKYSTWKGRCLFLEDLIVTESMRGQGIGKLLFNQIAALAKQKQVRRLEWQVLDWNAPAIAFYKTLQANFDSEWINCKLTGEQLQANLWE